MIMKLNFWVFLGLFFLLGLFPARAGDIMINGGWQKVIGNADTAGAGMDIPSTYVSNPGAGVLSINNVTGNWSIYVRRVDYNWPSGVGLALRRNSNGNGGGPIVGGEGYVEITPGDGLFFQGAGNVTDINLQYRISGVSRLVPPGSYGADIIFTINEN